MKYWMNSVKMDMNFKQQSIYSWVGASIVQTTLDLGQHQNRIGYTEILPQSQIANALGYERLIHETLRRR